MGLDFQISPDEGTGPVSAFHLPWKRRSSIRSTLGPAEKNSGLAFYSLATDMSIAPSSSSGEAWKELPGQAVAPGEDEQMHGLPGGWNQLSRSAGRVGWWGALHQGRPCVCLFHVVCS